MNPMDITHSFPVPEVLAVTGRRRLDFGSAGIVMTPEEFDAVTDYDDCYRYELVHGVLVVNPTPLEGEAAPNDLLGYLLLNYKHTHPQGSALDATLPERHIHGPDSRCRGDRVIWAGLGRVPNSKVDVPTIVVEFVSESRRDWQRDYVEKRHEYREAGVKEYWIVDRFQRRLTVYQYSEQSETEIIVAASEVYQTNFLPGFELPLARLLASADAWSPPPSK